MATVRQEEIQEREESQRLDSDHINKKGMMEISASNASAKWNK